MIEYPKMDTLLVRNKETFKVTKQLRRPEFGAIDQWFISEKVDGTNVRIHFERDGDTIGWVWGGRTARAELPSPLVSVIEETADSIESEVIKIFGEYDINSYTLFCEGYGPGIQKGGALSTYGPRVALYDILINDRTWLGVQDVVNASYRLGVDHVPVFPVAMKTNTVVQAVYEGLPSVFAIAYGVSGTQAEGVVCRTLEPLFNGRGQRVCWKLKTKDFDSTFPEQEMVE